MYVGRDECRGFGTLLTLHVDWEMVPYSSCVLAMCLSINITWPPAVYVHIQYTYSFILLHETFITTCTEVCVC